MPVVPCPDQFRISLPNQRDDDYSRNLFICVIVGGRNLIFRLREKSVSVCVCVCVCVCPALELGLVRKKEVKAKELSE